MSAELGNIMDDERIEMSRQEAHLWKTIEMNIMIIYEKPEQMLWDHFF